MDCYIIPPVSHLELMNYGSRYFCLAQLYRKYEHYREFFKQKVAEGKWVTLDSGIGDHEPVTQDILFEVTKDLVPSEVIPLDTLFDGEETYKNCIDFIKRLKAEDLDQKVSILSCPQGNDFDEWLDCYVKLSNLKEVKTIGMSKLSIPWVVSRSKGDVNIGRDRNFMFDYLKKEGLLKKQLHFLGAGEMSEYRAYKNSSYVRSTDSCFTVWMGMNMIELDSKDYKRIPTPRDYFDRTISKKQMEIVQKNIRIFKESLKDI